MRCNTSSGVILTKFFKASIQQFPNFFVIGVTSLLIESKLFTILKLKAMRKLKMNFARLTVPVKIQKAKAIVQKMTGNANFATPVPSLSGITAAIAKLEGSYEAAIDGGKSKTAAMHIDKDALVNLIKQLASYVQDISGGDETKILSSGFELFGERTPALLPEAPGDVRITAEGDGKITLQWNPVKFAKAYLVQMSDTPDAEDSWTIIDGSTRSRFMASHLQSLSIKWFRVAALGAAGRSTWSAPAKVIVT